MLDMIMTAPLYYSIPGVLSSVGVIFYGGYKLIGSFSGSSKQEQEQKQGQQPQQQERENGEQIEPISLSEDKAGLNSSEQSMEQELSEEIDSTEISAEDEWLGQLHQRLGDFLHERQEKYQALLQANEESEKELEDLEQNEVDNQKVHADELEKRNNEISTIANTITEKETEMNRLKEQHLKEEAEHQQSDITITVKIPHDVAARTTKSKLPKEIREDVTSTLFEKLKEKEAVHKDLVERHQELIAQRENLISDYESQKNAFEAQRELLQAKISNAKHELAQKRQAVQQKHRDLSLEKQNLETAPIVIEVPVPAEVLSKPSQKAPYAPLLLSRRSPSSLRSTIERTAEPGNDSDIEPINPKSSLLSSSSSFSFSSSSSSSSPSRRKARPGRSVSQDLS